MSSIAYGAGLNISTSRPNMNRVGPITRCAPSAPLASGDAGVHSSRLLMGAPPAQTMPTPLPLRSPQPKRVEKKDGRETPDLGRDVAQDTPMALSLGACSALLAALDKRRFAAGVGSAPGSRRSLSPPGCPDLINQRLANLAYPLKVVSCPW